MASQLYELRLDSDRDGVREVSLYGLDDDGQMRYIRNETFGPFDTSLEIAQWVWKYLTIDLASHTG